MTALARVDEESLAFSTLWLFLFGAGELWLFRPPQLSEKRCRFRINDRRSLLFSIVISSLGRNRWYFWKRLLFMFWRLLTMHSSGTLTLFILRRRRWLPRRWLHRRLVRRRSRVRRRRRLPRRRRPRWRRVRRRRRWPWRVISKHDTILRP